jgi:hypothetical protein
MRRFAFHFVGVGRPRRVAASGEPNDVAGTGDGRAAPARRSGGPRRFGSDGATNARRPHRPDKCRSALRPRGGGDPRRGRVGRGVGGAQAAGGEGSPTAHRGLGRGRGGLARRGTRARRAAARAGCGMPVGVRREGGPGDVQGRLLSGAGGALATKQKLCRTSYAALERSGALLCGRGSGRAVALEDVSMPLEKWLRSVSWSGSLDGMRAAGARIGEGISSSCEGFMYSAGRRVWRTCEQGGLTVIEQTYGREYRAGKIGGQQY